MRRVLVGFTIEGSPAVICAAIAPLTAYGAIT
jgi:hypothetical protein